jgi:DinB superfamily
MTGRPELPALAAEDHVCRACGLAYADLDVATAPAQLTELLDAFERAVRAVPVGVLGQRPEPSVWSPAEYACHVRDVIMVYTVRLHRARREERPALEPMYNDLRACRFGYRDADVPAILIQTKAAAQGLSAEIDRLRPEDWSRTVTRLPGEERTARWLVRQALHEVHHHTADIRTAAR